MNRAYSYGYGLISGKLSVISSEAETVKKIFSDYISGKALKSISENLTAEKTEYYMGKTRWSKSSVSRILSNRKYIGQDGYPIIIDSEMFLTANNIKTTKQADIIKKSDCTDYIKSVIICGECGKKMYLIADKRVGAKWYCETKCKRIKTIGEDELYERLYKIIERVNGNYDCLKCKRETVSAADSNEILCRKNEILQMLDRKNITFEAGKKAILDFAALKFSVYNKDKTLQYFDKITRKTQEVCKTKVIDKDFLSSGVKTVAVDKFGDLSVTFKTGAVITSKECEVCDGTDGEKDCN